MYVACLFNLFFCRNLEFRDLLFVFNKSNQTKKLTNSLFYLIKLIQTYCLATTWTISISKGTAVVIMCCVVMPLFSSYNVSEKSFIFSGVWFSGFLVMVHWSGTLGLSTMRKSQASSRITGVFLTLVSINFLPC